MLGVPLDRLYDSSRPVLFESDGDEFPYWGAGTCFLFTYCDKLYAATAGHNFQTASAEAMRIAAYDGSGIFLPLVASWSSDRSTHDYGDLHVVRVTRSPRRTRREAFRFDRGTLETGRSALIDDGDLVISGYPNCRQHIDYDANSVHRQRAVLAARHLGFRDNQDEWVRTLQIVNRSEVREVGGFSGSPVFGRGPDQSWGLAGVAIQGGESFRVQFIDAMVLWTFMEKITGGKASRAAG